MYATGSVNSLADLLTAIRGACTDNGWTLSGDVLHKGDAYIRSQIVSTFIQWLGGTGIDGSNALTGAAPAVVRNGGFNSQALTYPCTWEAHIHTDPDEVYIVLNYNVDYYQFAAFGLSDVAGLPGAGLWFTASQHAIAAAGSDSDFLIDATGSTFSSTSSGGPPFYAKSVGQLAQNSYIHHDIDGRGWSSNTAPTNPPNFAWSFPAVRPLLNLLPSAWNNETALLPFPIYVPRSSGNKVSLAADLKHVRHCRIDFHDPGDILTLGSDQWKLYPWYRKNAASRNGTVGLPYTHSGTFGFAVRYDA